MPASRFSSPQAAASHALTALERYRAHLRKLSTHWLDLELYRCIGDELDEIRQGCRELPEVSLAWVELLIAHAELAQGLWQGSRPGAPASVEARGQMFDRLAVRIAALQDKCLRVPPAPGSR